MSQLGTRLRQERQRHAPPLTLAEVAGKSVSVGLISKIERGLVNPSLATLAHLATRLHVPLARLFLQDEDAQAAAAAAKLDAARAALLLGDPATAAEWAAGAADALLPLAGLRARLLAVAAEALLAAGNSAGAAQRLSQGTSALMAAQDEHVSYGEREALAQAELASVLGALERRRSQPAAAQQAWTRALDALGGGPLVQPWPALLRAQLMFELASLHEVAGEQETARNFLARASAAVAGVTDPAGTARRLLTLGTWSERVDQVDTAPLDFVDQPNASAALMALTLAVHAAAKTLAESLTHALARLEHAPPARRAIEPPPAAALHSRHLR